MGGRFSKDDADLIQKSRQQENEKQKSPVKAIHRDWPSAQLRENRKFQKELENPQAVSKNSRQHHESGSKQSVRTQEQVGEAFSPLSNKEANGKYQSSEKLKILQESPFDTGKVGLRNTTIKNNKNVLPQMTQRVLQQKKVVLCRQPIFNHRSTQDNANNMTPNIHSILPHDMRMADTPSTNTNGRNHQNNSFTNENQLNNKKILVDIETSSTGMQKRLEQNDQSQSAQLQFNNESDQESAIQLQPKRAGESEDKDRQFQKRSSFKKHSLQSKGILIGSKAHQKQQMISQQRKNSDFSGNFDASQTYDNIIKQKMNLYPKGEDIATANSTQNSVMFYSNTSTKMNQKVKSSKKMNINSSYKKATAGVMTESNFNKVMTSEKKVSQISNQYITKINSKYSNGQSKFSPNIRSNSTIRGENNALINPTILKQGSIYQEVQSALQGPQSQRITKMASEGLPGTSIKAVYSRESSRSNNEGPQVKSQNVQKKKTAKEVNFSIQRKPHGFPQSIYTRSRKESTTQNFVKSISSNQFQQYQVKEDEQNSVNQQLQEEDQTKIEYYNNNDDQINLRDFEDLSLPKNVVLLILLFSIEEYPKLIRLSPGWYCFINDALDEYSNIIENSFVKKNSKFLNFQKSYINSSPIYFCKQQGIRLDRLFQCEVLPNSSVINQTLKLSYSFNYNQSTTLNKAPQTSILRLQDSTRYSVDYRFDVLRQGTKRVTWIHISDEIGPYAQNEIQVQQGDIIEFTVCLYNMNGLIDLNSLEWEYPEVITINQNEKDVLTYNRDIKLMQRKNDRRTKVHCDINRICEIEDGVPEWTKLGTLRRDQPRIPIPTKQFESRFKVAGIFFNELDWHFNKIVLQSIRKGTVEQKVFGEKVQVVVKGEDEPILNEVKKRGVIFDRNKDKERIQIRLGDIIVVYNTVKITEDMVPDVNIPLSEFHLKYNLPAQNTDLKVSLSENKQNSQEINGK